ncbi:purine-cytosine permease family protein [Saccharopolyspora sp. MS10]|uniref:purine-cytosine permease family protein n=1 Tax=Saccharopolyspora sp. MS10 TaxID=3385973 RepID=UPI0039A35280
MTDESTPTRQPAYGEAVAKVEPFSIDRIPDAERHGKPSSQFFVWFAANLNFPIMMLGFGAITLGLSFTAAATAVIAGAAAGSLLMATLSRMGVRLGVPQQIQARGPLGFLGNFLPVAYINVFAGVGWASVTVILGGKALAELLPIPFWVGSLALTAVQLVVAVFGYNMIHYLERILAFVLLALFLLITVVALTRGAGTFPADPGASGYVGGAGGWITFAGAFFAFLVAWSPFASDYSRYLPDSPRSSRMTAVYTGLGTFLTVGWLGIVGALLAHSTSTSDSIAALHELTGPFAVPALAAVILSALSQNFLNVYGGAISLQTLRLPLTRPQGVTLICVLAFLISLWGETGIEAKFEVFLSLTAYFIAPFATVLLLDYYLGGRSQPDRVAELYDPARAVGWGFVAWAAGVVASVPFWHSHVYTGALAAAHPEWGDLGNYVGAAAAAVVYLLTYRLPYLWTRALPSPATERVPAQK